MFNPIGFSDPFTFQQQVAAASIRKLLNKKFKDKKIKKLFTKVLGILNRNVQQLYEPSFVDDEETRANKKLIRDDLMLKILEIKQAFHVFDKSHRGLGKIDFKLGMFDDDESMFVKQRKRRRRRRGPSDIIKKTREEQRAREQMTGNASRENVECTANNYDDGENCWTDPITLDCIPHDKLYIAPNGTCYDATQLKRWINTKRGAPTYPDTNLPMGDEEIAAVLQI